MPGGTLQLLYRGEQDRFLTDLPEFSFFEPGYKRYTPFAKEAVRVDFKESFGFGKRLSATIPQKGDLVTKVYLYVKLPVVNRTSGTYAGYCNNIGHALVKSAELSIGDIRIDRLERVYLDALSELTIQERADSGNIMLGKYPNIVALETNAVSESSYYVELPFYFTKDPSLALPLCAVYRQDTKITLEFEKISSLLHFDGSDPPTVGNMVDAYLMVEYAFVRNDIQQEIIDKTHTFLIEQVQTRDPQAVYVSSVDNMQKYDLSFNHPVKELLWVFIEDESMINNDHFNYARRTPDAYGNVLSLMASAKLTVDGKDLFNALPEEYFRLVQSFQHHSTVPNKYIYCYNFGLRPEIVQPSGSLNFSKLTDAALYTKMTANVPNCQLYLYAVSYNFLIIKQGMAALAFAS